MATIHANAFDWSEWGMRSTSVCSVCNEVTQRPKIVFDKSGSVIYCKHCVPPALARGNPDVAKNPFENFTLDHFPRDEHGNKIVVNSVKELREAEKRSGAVLAMMSDNDISQPPQHEPDAGNIARDYQWKFCKDPKEKARYGSTGVSTGIARDASGTIAHLPNPV